MGSFLHNHLLQCNDAEVDADLELREVLTTLGEVRVGGVVLFAECLRQTLDFGDSHCDVFVVRGRWMRKGWVDRRKWGRELDRVASWEEGMARPFWRGSSIARLSGVEIRPYTRTRR